MFENKKLEQRFMIYSIFFIAGMYSQHGFMASIGGGVIACLITRLIEYLLCKLKTIPMFLGSIVLILFISNINKQLYDATFNVCVLTLFLYAVLFLANNDRKMTYSQIHKTASDELERITQ